MTDIMRAFVVVMSFVSVIPIPRRLIPDWNERTLKHFCPMLALSGLIFGALWLCSLLIPPGLPHTLRGFMMMLYTLALTGGLHMDGLMDTCDAVFSRKDRDTRLKILSDTHAGSFAVMGCVVVLMAKTLLFSELSSPEIFFVPVYSRLGMAFMLNNLPFAKTQGLAVILGASRNSRNNVVFALMAVLLVLSGGALTAGVWAVCLAVWCRVCVKVFGGITGDLLGAFVELSEVIMLFAGLWVI